MSKYNPEYIDNEEREIMESIETMDIEKLETPTKEEIKAAAKIL